MLTPTSIIETIIEIETEAGSTPNADQLRTKGAWLLELQYTVGSEEAQRMLSKAREEAASARSTGQKVTA